MRLPIVFVLGDSISIHYGPYLEEYLRGLFSYSRKQGDQAAVKNLDIPVGANGGDSFQVLQYLSSNSQHHEVPNADFLVLNCGLHDIKTNPTTLERQVTEKDYESSLQKIVAISQKLFRHIVWIRSTPVSDKKHNSIRKDFQRFNKDVIMYNEIDDRVMRRNHIVCIDLYRFTINLGPDVYCDHVHFTDDIRQKQARFIADHLLHLES